MQAIEMKQLLAAKDAQINELQSKMEELQQREMQRAKQLDEKQASVEKLIEEADRERADTLALQEEGVLYDLPPLNMQQFENQDDNIPLLEDTRFDNSLFDHFQAEFAQEPDDFITTPTQQKKTAVHSKRSIYRGVSKTSKHAWGAKYSSKRIVSTCHSQAEAAHHYDQYLRLHEPGKYLQLANFCPSCRLFQNPLNLKFVVSECTCLVYHANSSTGTSPPSPDPALHEWEGRSVFVSGRRSHPADMSSLASSSAANVPPQDTFSAGIRIELRTALQGQYWRNPRKNLQCFPSCTCGSSCASKIGSVNAAVLLSNGSRTGPTAAASALPSSVPSTKKIQGKIPAHVAVALPTWLIESCGGWHNVCVVAQFVSQAETLPKLLRAGELMAMIKSGQLIHSQLTQQELAEQQQATSITGGSAGDHDGDQMQQATFLILPFRGSWKFRHKLSLREKRQFMLHVSLYCRRGDSGCDGSSGGSGGSGGSGRDSRSPTSSDSSDSREDSGYCSKDQNEGNDSANSNASLNNDFTTGRAVTPVMSAAAPPWEWCTDVYSSGFLVHSTRLRDKANKKIHEDVQQSATLSEALLPLLAVKLDPGLVMTEERDSKLLAHGDYELQLDLAKRQKLEGGFVVTASLDRESRCGSVDAHASDNSDPAIESDATIDSDVSDGYSPEEERGEEQKEEREEGRKEEQEEEQEEERELKVVRDHAAKLEAAADDSAKLKAKWEAKWEAKVSEERQRRTKGGDAWAMRLEEGLEEGRRRRLGAKADWEKRVEEQMQRQRGCGIAQTTREIAIAVVSTVVNTEEVITTPFGIAVVVNTEDQKETEEVITTTPPTSGLHAPSLANPVVHSHLNAALKAEVFVFAPPSPAPPSPAPPSPEEEMERGPAPQHQTSPTSNKSPMAKGLMGFAFDFQTAFVDALIISAGLNPHFQPFSRPNWGFYYANSLELSPLCVFITIFTLTLSTILIGKSLGDEKAPMVLLSGRDKLPNCVQKLPPSCTARGIKASAKAAAKSFSSTTLRMLGSSYFYVAAGLCCFGCPLQIVYRLINATVPSLPQQCPLQIVYRLMIATVPSLAQQKAGLAAAAVNSSYVNSSYVNSDYPE
jgi:hypothetical protein